MTPLEIQLGQLRDRFGEASILPLPSSTSLILLPAITLPAGWSKPASSIRFLVPVGYPFAALDCFWADQDLRLLDQRMPQNTAINPIPETSEVGLWFSWHLSAPWNANRDTLSSWMNTILERMRTLN